MRTLEAYFAAGVTRMLLALIRLYQLTLSPWLGRGCRHVPTCSAYAAEAIERFGAARGAWLVAKRLARCQPWGTFGYDPVPAAEGRGAHARGPLDGPRK